MIKLSTLYAMITISAVLLVFCTIALQSLGIVSNLVALIVMPIYIIEGIYCMHRAVRLEQEDL